jgi:hypothetical protein
MRAKIGSLRMIHAKRHSWSWPSWACQLGLCPPSPASEYKSQPQRYQYYCIIQSEAIQLHSRYPHPVRYECLRGDLLDVQQQDTLLRYQMTTTLSCPHTKRKLRACRPVVAVTIKQSKAIKIDSEIKYLLEHSKRFRQWKVRLWNVQRSCHQISRSVTHQKPCVGTSEDHGEDLPPTPRDPGSIARIVELNHRMVQILHHK